MLKAPGFVSLWAILTERHILLIKDTIVGVNCQFSSNICHVITSNGWLCTQTYLQFRGEKLLRGWVISVCVWGLWRRQYRLIVQLITAHVVETHSTGSTASMLWQRSSALPKCPWATHSESPSALLCYRPSHAWFPCREGNRNRCLLQESVTLNSLLEKSV